jgi:biotin/methionine sulfoxide reductase
LYEGTRQALQAKGLEAPDFETFWERGSITLPQHPDDGGIQRAFRQDPATHPLPTESGKVQISSPRIAAFGYANCPGHPAWLPSTEEPNARHPLILISNQPVTKLHSQLDFGAYSQSEKRRGREVCRLHPQDAESRGIRSGDLLRVFNDRGACLACAELTEDLRPGVIVLPTGSWYDPGVDAQGRPLCVHGNPNVLTRDIGTSSLAQGCGGMLTVVQVERFDEPVPPVTVLAPPTRVDRA